MATEALPHPRRRFLAAVSGAALLALAMLAALARVGPSPASGALAAASIGLDPAAAPPGRVVWLTGSDFLPGGCQATVWWDGEPWETLDIALGGQFRAPLQVPPAAAVGDHDVAVVAAAPCLGDSGTVRIGLRAEAVFSVASVRPGSELVPDLGAGPDELVLVLRATFRGREDVSLQSAEVSRGGLPLVVDGPRLLQVTALDANGEVVTEYDTYHPLWFEGRGAEGRLQVARPAQAPGRFVLPFRGNLATVLLTDLGLGRQVARLDVSGAVDAYCAARPADPACAWGQPAIGVVAPTAPLQVGRDAIVDVTVRDVRQLYGAQLRLTFDPFRVAVLDADPGQPGVQGRPGDFLSPDVTVLNSADNARGRVDYVASLMGDRPGVSGGGVLLRLTLRALRPGASPLRLEAVRLSDPRSLPIEATIRPGQVQVVTPRGDDTLVDVVGRVLLDGRLDGAGARVCVDDDCATTGPGGRFRLVGVPRGPLVVTRPGFLAAGASMPPPTAGVTVTLGDLTLRAGDADGDGVVGEGDAVEVARAFGDRFDAAGWNEALDFTGDGEVELGDLALLGSSFGAQAESFDGRSTALRPVSATVRLRPPAAGMGVLAPPQPVEIVLEGGPAVFAYSLILSFDPARLRVVDPLDPSRDGLPRFGVGPLLLAGGMAVVNGASNARGAAQLVMTRLKPAGAVAGDGILGTLYVQALQAGPLALHIEELRLYGAAPGERAWVPDTGMDGLWEATGGAVFLPITFVSR